MVTTTALKKEIRDEFQCPAEFIRSLSRNFLFTCLQDAVASDDKAEAADIKKLIREEYRTYCKYTNLDVAADNRQAQPGFFIWRR